MGFVDAFGNGTVPPARWVPEPNERGTWGILSSCVITLILCIWTCLHLNVPEPGVKFAQWPHKIRWLIIGLLAPEIVAYNAWAQRSAANYFTKRMRNELGLEPEPSLSQSTKNSLRRFFRVGNPNEDIELDSKSNTRPQYEWSIEHSFLTYMGGFAFDTSKAELNFLPNGYTRLCIRPRGLLRIAQLAPHLIPRLTLNNIKDKSKADGLAKTVVCIQASWFCIQCIFRLASSQLISLLEINTFCHALCALVIYGLWWRKPLDVEEPVLLEGPEADRLCAFMCMTSSCIDRASRLVLHHVFQDRYTGEPVTEVDHGFKFGDYRLKDWRDLLSGRYINHVKKIRSSSDRLFSIREPGDDGHNGSADMADQVSSTGITMKNNDVLHGLTVCLYGQISSIDLYPEDCLRFKLCSEAVKSYSLSFASDNCEGVTFHMSNLSSSTYLDYSSSHKNTVQDWGVCLTGFFYGGIHLLAWNAPMASFAEVIIWRFSGILIASTFMTIAIVEAQNWVFRKLEPVGNSRKSSARAALSLTVSLFTIFIIGMFLLAYGFARSFLVIESFIQLARLPAGVYQQTKWPRYVPHIT